MDTNAARIVPFPSTRPRLHPSAWQGFTSFASPQLNSAEYEGECLAGRCFPRPGDTAMLHRCREEYGIHQWLELFRRFHTNRYASPSNEACVFRRYFPPLLAVRPTDLTRHVVMEWFHEIGRHSRSQANKSLSLLRTLYTKAEEWNLWEGENPATKIRWYKKIHGHALSSRKKCRRSWSPWHWNRCPCKPSSCSVSCAGAELVRRGR